MQALLEQGGVITGRGHLAIAAPLGLVSRAPLAVAPFPQVCLAHAIMMMCFSCSHAEGDAIPVLW